MIVKAFQTVKAKTGNPEKWKPAAQNRHKSPPWSKQPHPVGLHTPTDRSIRLKQTQNGLNTPGKERTPPAGQYERKRKLVQGDRIESVSALYGVYVRYFATQKPEEEIAVDFYKPGRRLRLLRRCSAYPPERTAPCILNDVEYA